MQTSAEFEKAYNRLNAQQKTAVDTIDGPVLVVAGPGTGKTQILTLRIANIILKTGIEPESILALTFTESGVKAMRERLAKFIGHTAYYVNITTFHSFSSEVLNSNPDYFLLGNNSRIATDLEKLTIIQNILNKSVDEVEYIRPAGDPFFYSNYILRCISDLKREGVTYKKYKDLIRGHKKNIEELENQNKITAKDKNIIKDLSKQIELGFIYKNYQKELKRQNLYDFEDLINKVNYNFKKFPTLLQDYQEKYQYILVDEFQDTNNAQYQILRNLTSYWGPEADIFAVGDDEQSIYRFQGASLQNILDFTKDFPNTTVITLKENYRSTQLILDSSRSLIKNNNISIEKYFSQIDKELNANTNLDKLNITTINFSNGLTEAYYISTKIKELIENGEDPNEIAVLYRYNSDSAQIANMLSKMNVLYNLEGGENILTHPTITKFVHLLKVIELSKNNEENLDLFNILSLEFLGFDEVDNLKITRKAANKKTTLYSYILSSDFIKDKIVEDPQKYLDFLVEKLPYWQKIDQQKVFTETFEKILEDSGYLNYILSQENPIEEINKINSLYEEVKSWVNINQKLKIADFLQNIEILNKNNLKIPETDFDISSNAVTLCTAHKSKGLEFKHVFIYGFTDKKWGNNTVRELIKLPEGILAKEVEDAKKEKNEDERRLFYVSLTRAKQNLCITSANKYVTSWGEKETEKSMFYYELPQECIDEKNIEKIETKDFIKEALKNVFISTETTNVSDNEKALLQNLIENYKLSPTGLKTYLDCGYKFKLNTLLKTPRSKATYLSFGTAIHTALENMYRKYKAEKKLPAYDFLYETFEAALKKEPLSEKELKTHLKLGKRLLITYYENYKDEFVKPEYLERTFGRGFNKIMLEDIELTGKVDRIEETKTESGVKYVKVVDYKTGKPKSRNEILGKTKYSDGDYKRQLVFYKILCDLDRTFKYKAVSFELDFVGDGRGAKPKKEIFEITEQEVQELKDLIMETMQKIRNMQFERTTDYTICDKCDYKLHCWPNGTPTIAYKQNTLELQ